MRMSRLLLLGGAVAGAAAVTTSAFTAANDFTAVTPPVAGYGQTVVSGATVTDVGYTLLSTDNSKLDSVVFTTTTDVSAGSLVATMTIKDGTSVVGTYSCVKGAYTTQMTLTCNATDDPLLNAFDTLGLTVSE